MGVGDRPVVSVILFKEDGNAVAIGPSGVIGVAFPGHLIGQGVISGTAGLVRGYAATSSTAITACRATAYTEPASAMQMELVSSSANDSAAGTGSRVVRVTYYNGSMDGPFTEDVTMNGTTPVDTVATDIRYIEKLDTLTVGSNGTNVGTISIRETDGSPTYGSIAVGDGTTFWAHHYVAAGKRCYVTRLLLGTQGNAANFFIRYMDPLTANAFERQMTPNLRCISNQPSQMHDTDSNFSVAGPARLTLYGRSDSATANTHHGGFSYYEL